MDSPIKVTRSTSAKNGDIEVQSWASSSSRSGKNKIFPFSTALSSSVPCNDSVTSSLKSKFDNGVFLTWKDLSVVIPSGKKENRKHAILQELTGYVEPGQILAIMGPSGCGKSTLLDALAGRLSSNTEQTGEILINGCKETLAFGTSVRDSRRHSNDNINSNGSCILFCTAAATRFHVKISEERKS